MELCIMLLECCSQERTYLRYYGLLGTDALSWHVLAYIRLTEEDTTSSSRIFIKILFQTIYVYGDLLFIFMGIFVEENGTKLPFFKSDLLAIDTMNVKMQELSEQRGIWLLNERLNDPTMQESFESIFPKDNPWNTRFAINFFTSIGLGGITENLREYLKNMPRLIMQQQKAASESEGDSGSDSDSLSGSKSESESDSSSSGESDKEVWQRKKRRRG
ncbi:hypothetical protein Ancab_000113 [Ancistrocladus abbreviatus]